MNKTNLSTVGYRLTRNATSTAAKAPYLGIAIPVGSLAYDNILEKMIDSGTFMTKATAQYFLNSFFEFAADEIAANAVRVNMGAVSIYPMIGGAFDSEDDQYREPRNSLYVGATFSQALRDAVAGITPDYNGEKASGGSVRICSVFDLASMTNRVIDGTNDFRICGIDLTVPDGEDESLTLVTKDGATKAADIVVSSSEDGQRITCHLVAGDEEIPKGTYRVRLASHGLDPTAPLTVTSFKVTLTSPVVPVPDDHAVLTDLRTSAEDTPSELSIDDGLTLTFDKADPEGRTGHLVVNGVEQSAPVTVDQAMTMVMWTFGREELIGQEVTFNFRYEDGTEVGEVKKTIREER